MRPEGLELQAVLLCGGRGSRLSMIHNLPPKCLLRVGPYPLIWYSLNLLEKQGFTDVFVIVLESQKNEIVEAVDKFNFKLKIDYFTISDDDANFGTANSVKLLHDTGKIVADLLIMSCDLITNVNIDNMLKIHRKHNATSVALLFNNRPLDFLKLPGPKTKDTPERDLIGIDKETERLVFMASASDFEENVPLSRALLKKHPCLSVYSRLLDSHIYIIKKEAIDFLVECQSQSCSFLSVKGEFLPYLVKKQFTNPENCKDKIDNKVETKPRIFEHVKRDEDVYKIMEKSLYNDNSHGMKGYNNDVIKCYAYVPPQDEFYAIRVNSLPTYWNVNNKIIGKWNEIVKGVPLEKHHKTSEVKSRQVDEFSFVGENSFVSEKTSIKNTTISSNCKIENKVRLSNCILMNNVTVKEGCVLQDCIIFSDVTINSGAELKFCIVSPNCVIEENENKEQHIFSMNFEDDDDDDDSDE